MKKHVWLSSLQLAVWTWHAVVVEAWQRYQEAANLIDVCPNAVCDHLSRSGVSDGWRRARLKAPVYKRSNPILYLLQTRLTSARDDIVDARRALIAQTVWWVTSHVTGECLFTPTQVGRMWVAGGALWLRGIHCDFSWQGVLGWSQTRRDFTDTGRFFWSFLTTCLLSQMKSFLLLPCFLCVA